MLREAVVEHCCRHRCGPVEAVKIRARIPAHARAPGSEGRRYAARSKSGRLRPRRRRGSVEFADPHARVAFGYAMNAMGPRYGNPRPRGLIEALYECL